MGQFEPVLPLPGLAHSMCLLQCMLGLPDAGQLWVVPCMLESAHCSSSQNKGVCGWYLGQSTNPLCGHSTQLL